MIRPKYDRPLNNEQLAVLAWLHTVRFSSTKQLARRLNKSSQQSIQHKLQILERQDFIGKRYDKSYKLQGKPAEYYLTPRGARELERRRPGIIDISAVNVLYKNKTVSPSFIAHCLCVADTMLRLQAIHSTNFKQFTKVELAAYDYFPTWKPDLFLSFTARTKSAAIRCYFLDVWDDSIPFFVMVRKVRNYITYAKEGDWPTDEHAMPTVLAVCQNGTIEKKLRRQITRALDEKYITDEILFATTTKEQLVGATSTARRIWWRIAESDGSDDDNEAKRMSL